MFKDTVGNMALSIHPLGDLCMQSSLKSDNTLGGVTILVNHISSWVLQPEGGNS